MNNENIDKTDQQKVIIIRFKIEFRLFFKLEDFCATPCSMSQNYCHTLFAILKLSRSSVLRYLIHFLSSSRFSLRAQVLRSNNFVTKIFRHTTLQRLDKKFYNSIFIICCNVCSILELVIALLLIGVRFKFLKTYFTLQLSKMCKICNHTYWG